MLALTRHADQQPDAPYGCVFVVDQIKKADEAFKELNALIPGKVAVWTNEHDRGCKKRTRVPHPAAEFIKDDLRHYPIIVVTHAFYNGPTGNKAHVLVRNKRVYSGCALTLVDERPEEVLIYETTLKEAQSIREKLEEKRPDLKQVLDNLMLFMMPYTINVRGGIMRASDRFGQEFVADQLDWFTTTQAEGVLRDQKAEIAGLDQLFGFARAMTLGCAFAAPQWHRCAVCGMAEQTHGAPWDDPVGRYSGPRWCFPHLSLATARQHTTGPLWKLGDSPCPATHEETTKRVSQESSESTCIRQMDGRDHHGPHGTGRTRISSL